MKEGENVWKLVSLAVLMACMAAIYFFQQKEERPVVDPGLFRAVDPTRIDQVILESVRGKTILRYDGNHWKVNEHYQADQALIDVLFAALAQAVPKRPVASGQRDTVNAILASQGTTVSLIEGAAVTKKFIAGGNQQKRETYFRLPESDTYLMAIPGYRVYLADIFAIDENGWRDKRIFDFAWRNFKSLKVSFAGDPASGFEINRPDMKMTVAVKEIADPDTSRVNSYLDDVLRLTADQILASGTKRYDSLSATHPIGSIEIADIAGHQYRLELFPPLPGETVVLGKAHDADRVLFDRKKLFRVVKKRSYFVRKTG